MTEIIKSLHTFLTLSRNTNCTSMGLATPELPCHYTLPKGPSHHCTECVFDGPDLTVRLQAIKIIGEHSERTD